MIEPYQYQLRQLSELPTTNQDTVRQYQSVPGAYYQAVVTDHPDSPWICRSLTCCNASIAADKMLGGA